MLKHCSASILDTPGDMFLLPRVEPCSAPYVGASISVSDRMFSSFLLQQYTMQQVGMKMSVLLIWLTSGSILVLVPLSHSEE